MVGKVVTKMGETVRMLGMMYKAVVQLVLVYRSKIWVVKDSMLKVLEGLHHWTVRKIVGIAAQHTTSGEWDWPPVDEALDATGLWPIK